MVRQTIAIRGEPKDEASKVPIEEKIIELFNEEQFCEHYLCEVNPEGQVLLSKPTGTVLSPVLLKPSPSRYQCLRRRASTSRYVIV